MRVNETEYSTIRLLGKGKGGYSYLARLPYTKEEIAEMLKRPSRTAEELWEMAQKDEFDDYETYLSISNFPTGYMFEGFDTVPKEYVLLKQIHHEPCDYYNFGNKIEAEKRDYRTLWNLGIRIPKMYAVDENTEIIVKEFIDGPTVMMLLEKSGGELPSGVLDQIREIAEKVKAAGLNIDYYPTNFILDKNGLLYYIDYECNAYMEEWSFDNWGVKYWTKTPELMKCLKERQNKG